MYVFFFWPWKNSGKSKFGTPHSTLKKHVHGLSTAEGRGESAKQTSDWVTPSETPRVTCAGPSLTPFSVLIFIFQFSFVWVLKWIFLFA